jgi:hypothetical protein
MPHPTARLPLAWHLIWTTYGTWLPGDDRGWRRRGDPTAHPPDPALAAAVRAALRFPPLYFDAAQRVVVAGAIEAACARPGWRLYACVVRTSHVHVVLTAPMAAKQARRALKARATRALVERDAELAARVIWTRSGWVRVLGSYSDVDGAVAYANDDHHGRRR